MGVITKGIVGSVAFALGFYTATQHMAERYQYDQNRCDQYLEERLEILRRNLFPQQQAAQGAPPQQQAPYAPGQQQGQQGYPQQYQQQDPITRFEGIIDNIFDLLAPDLPQLPPTPGQQYPAPQQQQAPPGFQQPSAPQLQQPNQYQSPQTR